MSIAILVGGERQRAWVGVLKRRLEERIGQTVAVHAAGGEDERPLAFERIDRRLFGSPRPDLLAWETLATSDLPANALVIDLTEGGVPGEHVLTPLFNGQRGRAGMAASVQTSGLPRLSVRLGPTRELIATELALVSRESVALSLNAILARLVTLLERAVLHLVEGLSLPITAPGAAEPHRPAPKLKGYAKSVAHRLAGPLVRTGDWTIGWQQARTGRPAEPDPANLQFLAMDYDRFAADPMLFAHGERTWLFFEDYDYARALGRLSCVQIGGDGRARPPVTVMERTSHLSYPFVFAHEGTVYMVPETSADRRVELWRATDFPTGWERCAVLLDGVEAVDATIRQDAESGRWWMFASVAEPGASTYDTLSIYWSEALTGPWTAHKLNPVKLDAASSRPAGPIVEQDGAWWRPAQDCTRGYGSGLAWCRIDALDPEQFAETVVERWQPSGGYRGLHTYTQAGGWAAIDLQRRRWRTKRS
ncbi:hypothetical protein GCM10022281_14540 [Sphingomonas rosea]|uniref:Glucosamine inositolphosphorylceramide transferase 1 N-terminal domain-containing protein n=1 Tax=Sphingomonas rosea TaxID=335605 RepID=A0ABP7U3K7_9SPHN